MNSEQTYYTGKEVAEMLGVTTRTIRNYLKEGKLKEPNLVDGGILLKRTSMIIFNTKSNSINQTQILVLRDMNILI